MANQISSSTAMQLYSTTFQMAFQAGQRLQNTTQERHNTTGTALHVPVIDKIEMSEASFAPSNIPVSQITQNDFLVTQRNFNKKTVVGWAEKTLFNYDEVQAYAQTQAEAVARVIDKVKIDAFFSDPDYNPATSFTNIDLTVGVNTGVNSGKMEAGLAALEGQGIDVTQQMPIMMFNAANKPGFFEDERVVNFFYNNEKPLVTNRIQGFLGTDIRTLPNTAGGDNTLPVDLVAPINMRIPIFSKDAIYISFNREPLSYIWWNPGELRWEIVTSVVCGAKIVQPRGVVMLQANVNAVPNS